ncbi:MAG: DNA mismatch repair endonuclease MutL [Chloroflexota bacterium]
MPIHILPTEVVSKIAAGEVIERPASVVKELVENSLDAGATQIAVETQDGGVGLIRVTDNGSGIACGELEPLGKRHVTSKIATIDDLEKLATLGFRGEALASIAAVAELEILARTDAEPAGTYAAFKKGDITHQESRARTRGTTVTMRYLFRHFPARLKFLRSTATENGHITTLVTQYALAFPEVKFSLVMDNRPTIQTPGTGQLRDAVSEIYGPETARQMMEINGAGLVPAVTGLTSPPSVFRSTRNYVSFFVNRRWVRSPMLMRAMEQAYVGWLTSDKHPIVIASITISPQDLDVNVHPRKVEVRFRQEPVVFAAVEKAVKKALGIAPVNVVPATSVTTLGVQSQVTVGTGHPGQPPLSTLPDNAPLWRVQPDSNALPVLRVVGQLANSYVLAEGPDGLYLIDQHAAHERILYERIQSQVAERKVEVQGLLEPATVNLSPRQEELLKNGVETLRRFGFDIEPFGPRSFLVRAVPGVVRRADPTAVISELVDGLSAGETSPAWEERISQSLACHGAIKAGDPLSHEEMRGLVRELEMTRRPYTCPHGRPAIVHMDSRQLAKQFGRG